MTAVQDLSEVFRTRQILPHVRDRDPLAITVETLHAEAVGQAMAARSTTVDAQPGLPAWAATAQDRHA